MAKMAIVSFRRIDYTVGLLNWKWNRLASKSVTKAKSVIFQNCKTFCFVGPLYYIFATRVKPTLLWKQPIGYRINFWLMKDDRRALTLEMSGVATWPEFAGAKERTRDSTQPCHATPLNSNPSLRGEWPERSSSLYGQYCQANLGDSNAIKISKIRPELKEVQLVSISCQKKR